MSSLISASALDDSANRPPKCITIKYESKIIRLPEPVSKCRSRSTSPETDRRDSETSERQKVAGNCRRKRRGQLVQVKTR